MAELVDSEVANLLLADLKATLTAIWSEMASELGAYAMAHVDPADRSEADIKVITDRAVEGVDAATARAMAALEIASQESERRVFEFARTQ